MKKLLTLLVTILCMLSCVSFQGITAEAANGTYSWVKLPYTSQKAEAYDYLYVVGGYHSVDTGCPFWGSTNPADLRFIGDSMGDFVITYSDGSVDKIPLVFGYTMWFFDNWSRITLPFKGAGADAQAKANLQDALHLLGAYENNISCVFKVKVQNKGIKSLTIQDNPAKNGEPRFGGAYLTKGSVGELVGGIRSVDTNDTFFRKHTIDSKSPYPDRIKNLVLAAGNAVMTYDWEYDATPAFTFPTNAPEDRVVFSGNSIANAATGVVYHNLQNLINRTDADGFLHSSYYGSPAWRESFGTWISNANTFYDCCYSRDVSRGVLSLLTYGRTAKASVATNFVNKWMMYFPENNKQIKGVDIPGHYTVVVNKPMLYSTSLTVSGNWPTKYTYAAFGEGYQNLGNQETDGHGLMMLANYNLWRNSGSTKEWVNQNWTYINEGAEWILWCYEHPEISFVFDGLLYAESEGGLQQYTLYCNVPCYLGLLGYAQMAEKVGKTAEAAAWRTRAEEMYKAIYRRLGHDRKGGWIKGYFGFYHDPVVTMMADFYGFDTADMDGKWVKRSRLTYQTDIVSIANAGYFGANGIGYDHAMITQNALLLDQMADAGKLLTNLTKIGYAPGLPEEFIIPESVSVDAQAGIIRRQGDLGNCVQLSESLKCYAIAVGVSPIYNETLKIMPRLPDGWDVNVKKFALSNAKGAVDLQVSYPKDGKQTASFTLHDASGFDTVKFRMGPLPMDTQEASVKVNGKKVSSTLEVSGDSAWVWVTLSPSSKKQELSLAYGGYTPTTTTTQTTPTTTTTTQTTTDQTQADDAQSTTASAVQSDSSTATPTTAVNADEQEGGIGVIGIVAIVLTIVVVAEAVFVIFAVIKKRREK